MAPITQLSQLDLRKSYTYADYLTWEFSEYVEMVNGRVLPYVPGRRPAHQQCLMNLMLAVHAGLQKRPEIMVQIPFDVCPAYQVGQADSQLITVVQPDLLVASDQSKIQERGCFGAPDWLVEIVSPDFIDRDIRLKFDLYEENGVREYWIMYPGHKTITAFILENGQYKLAQEYIEPGLMQVATLSGLALEWTEIFAED